MAKHQNDAINWARRPDEGDMPQSWDMLTVPAKGISGIIVLSGDVTGAYVHYANGRSTPCGGRDCPLCDNNQKPRWEGYLAVTNRQMTARKILRLTPGAMPPIEEYFGQHRSLRGSTLEIQRHAQRPNGKLRTAIATSTIPNEALPKPPNMQRFLTTMWGLHKTTSAEAPAPATKRPAPSRETDWGDDNERAPASNGHQH